MSTGEIPAEAQQDDAWSRDLARQLLNGVLTVRRMAETIDAALASRSSSDTETLRRVRQVLSEADERSRLGIPFPEFTDRIRAALDGER